MQSLRTHTYFGYKAFNYQSQDNQMFQEQVLINKQNNQNIIDFIDDFKNFSQIGSPLKIKQSQNKNNIDEYNQDQRIQYHNQQKIQQKQKVTNDQRKSQRKVTQILIKSIFILWILVIAGIITLGLQSQVKKYQQIQKYRSHDGKQQENLLNDNIKVSITTQKFILQSETQIQPNKQPQSLQMKPDTQKRIQKENKKQNKNKLIQQVDQNSIKQNNQKQQKENNIKQQNQLNQVNNIKIQNKTIQNIKQIQNKLLNSNSNVQIKKQNKNILPINDLAQQPQNPSQRLKQRPINQNSQETSNKMNQSLKIQNISQNKKQQFKNQEQQNLQSNQIPVDQCLQYIKKQLAKNGYLYTFKQPMDSFKLMSNVKGFSIQDALKITNQQYSEAIELLYIIHRVNADGNVVVSDNPCQKAQETKKRLTQVMNQQFKRLNQTYQIDHYNQHQLRFCIVTNSYKNAQSGLIYRNIDSILQQNYTNYHVVYTDDASPDMTGQKVKDYLTLKGDKIMDKFQVKINQVKKGMMENIYNAVTQDCDAGEIVVMVDGDDALIGVNVLSFLNAVYQKQRVAMLWNNFLQINQNRGAVIGFSRSYFPQEQVIGNRRSGFFVSSHLKSFYVDLFRKIKAQDLQQYSGKFYGGASDTAMMNPMIEMSSPNKFKYIPQILYEYRFDTGQLGMNMNRQAQSDAIRKIGISKPYQPLNDFTFIEKSIEKVYQETDKAKKKQKQTKK